MATLLRPLSHPRNGILSSKGIQSRGNIASLDSHQKNTLCSCGLECHRFLKMLKISRTRQPALSNSIQLQGRAQQFWTEGTLRCMSFITAYYLFSSQQGQDKNPPANILDWENKLSTISATKVGWIEWNEKKEWRATRPRQRSPLSSPIDFLEWSKHSTHSKCEHPLWNGTVKASRPAQRAQQTDVQVIKGAVNIIAR